MWRNFIFITVAMTSSWAMGDIADPVVTYAESYQGYATIAGTVALNGGAPLGIRVINGDISYSTITDDAGRWGIVIRHRGFNYSEKAFDLKNSSNQSHGVTTTLKTPGF